VYLNKYITMKGLKRFIKSHLLMVDVVPFTQNKMKEGGIYTRRKEGRERDDDDGILGKEVWVFPLDNTIEPAAAAAGCCGGSLFLLVCMEEEKVEE